MNRRPHKCLARQYSDQMVCHVCGLCWDMNDPDPPECQKVDRRSKEAKEGVDAGLLHAKERRGLPDELPHEIATEMVKAYHANARDDLKGRVEGMRAAYRVFLDFGGDYREI